MAGILVVGNVCFDLIAKPIDRFPEKGSLVPVEQLELHSGGCAVNTANALAKLGVPVRVVGKVGDDIFGNFLLEDLKANGVNIRYVVATDQALTSTTFVVVSSDGERSFFHFEGSNADFRLEDVDLASLEDAQIMHIAGELAMPQFDGQPTADLLRQAKEAGLTTSLDTSWDKRGRWLSALQPCFPYLDVFLPSLAEAKMITGESDVGRMGDFVMEQGVKMLGLKLGSQGCYLRSQEEELTIPAYQVECQDTTGAGDCFAAGFLTGLRQGWDLETTGKFALAVGALCVTALGATTAVPALAQVQEFINRTPLRS